MNQETIQINGSIFSKDNFEQLKKNDEAPDSWENAIFLFLKNWFDDTDFVTTHTSGSTGIPKEIRLAKTAMRNSARMTNAFFGLNEEKTALLCLPASYIAGKMMLVRAITGGFNLVTTAPKANPFEQLKMPIDFTAITPYQLYYSAETLKQKAVQNIIVGGGHVNSTLETLAESIPTDLFETYGMTETCSHIALRQFNGENKSDVFSVLNGVSIRLDERECLVITAPHLLNEAIITNDVVEIKGKNTFRWLGRFDTTINSGGVKIHPEQVEKKLDGIIPSSFFIASQLDNILGEKVILVIESDDYSASRRAELTASIENRLSKFEIPKAIYFAPEFVYSSANKILRKETLQKLNQ